MGDRGLTGTITDTLGNIFNSDDDLELQMGIGDDLDAAYQDALERAPDYVDDDAIEQRDEYGTFDPAASDLDIGDDLEDEQVVAGIRYSPEERSRKTSGSGPAYDEPGQDGSDLLTDRF